MRALSIRRAAMLSAALVFLLASAGVAPAAPAPAARLAPVALRIVAINDFHGHLQAEAASSAPGAVALAATLARLRQTSSRTVFVSAGDLIGASPLPSALAHDEPTLAVFHQLGLQANTIGNHELDGGLAELQRQQALAGFPFLSANLVDLATGKPVFAPYFIVEVEGVRVAFVGATVRNALKPLEPESVPGLRLDDEVQALNAQAALLRAQGVHALVALLHEGAGAQDSVIRAEDCDALAGPAREITQKLDPDFDLVLSAHTHALYACRVGKRWLLQGGARGRYLSVADLELDRNSGDVLQVRTREEAVAASAETDAAVSKLVDAAVAAADIVAKRVVGTLDAPRVSAMAQSGSGSPLGAMIANAQSRAGAAYGAQFACTNPSSVPHDLVASGEGNQVTYADARAVQPYGNHLKVLKVSGAQLRALLEQQRSEASAPTWLSCSREISYQFDEHNRIPGEHLRVDMRPVADSDQVTMVANSYLARGGQGFSALTGVVPLADAGLDLDALLSWLAVQSPARCTLVAGESGASARSSCAETQVLPVTPHVSRYLSRFGLGYRHEFTNAQVREGLSLLDELLATAESGRPPRGIGDADKAWTRPRGAMIEWGLAGGVSLVWSTDHGTAYTAERDDEGRLYVYRSTL